MYFLLFYLLLFHRFQDSQTFILLNIFKFLINYELCQCFHSTFVIRKLVTSFSFRNFFLWHHLNLFFIVDYLSKIIDSGHIDSGLNISVPLLILINVITTHMKAFNFVLWTLYLKHNLHHPTKMIFIFRFSDCKTFEWKLF